MNVWINDSGGGGDADDNDEVSKDWGFAECRK